MEHFVFCHKLHFRPSHDYDHLKIETVGEPGADRLRHFSESAVGVGNPIFHDAFVERCLKFILV